ncbi:unnamed protein product [Protopolystoma xenopodis]|uniref:EF-hand domain-containing protein n=1 Tax=Protopolystoma xenopodis TaxID=117903 RepID=A0A448XH18_9PLAT|nr:unnamed protein product [Protopolystoma xenopodis]
MAAFHYSGQVENFDYAVPRPYDPHFPVRHGAEQSGLEAGFGGMETDMVDADPRLGIPEPIETNDAAVNGGFGRFANDEYLRSPEDMTEDEYRDWINRQFKCIFAPYEKQGGIPVQQALIMFQYNDYGLPKERRHHLFLKMDANKDGRINYEVGVCKFVSC